MSKVAQKVTTAVYKSKWMFSKQPKKSTYIWAAFVRKFVTKNFQKLPNLVTLVATDGQNLARNLCQTPKREDTVLNF